MATSPSAPQISVFRSNLFEGRVAVVTGGGTGIGFAISFELLELGFVKLTFGLVSEVVSSSVKVMGRVRTDSDSKVERFIIWCEPRLFQSSF